MRHGYPPSTTQRSSVFSWITGESTWVKNLPSIWSQKVLSIAWQCMTRPSIMEWLNGWIGHLLSMSELCSTPAVSQSHSGAKRWCMQCGSRIACPLIDLATKLPTKYSTTKDLTYRNYLSGVVKSRCTTPPGPSWTCMLKTDTGSALTLNWMVTAFTLQITGTSALNGVLSSHVETRWCHTPNMFGTVDIGIMSPAFQKTEELFQEHFYRLGAPGVEEEEDCGYHPTRRLLWI